jgi:hypothetical protein
MLISGNKNLKFIKGVYFVTPPPPKLIEFYIGNSSYHAIEGMTWEEWADSKYNVDGYYILGNFVHIGSSCTLYKDKNSTYLYSNEEIINGHTYWRYCGGSGD